MSSIRISVAACITDADGTEDLDITESVRDLALSALVAQARLEKEDRIRMRLQELLTLLERVRAENEDKALLQKAVHLLAKIVRMS